MKNKDQQLIEEAYSKHILKEGAPSRFDSVNYAMKKYNMTLSELNDLIDEEGENAWDYFRSFQTPEEVDDYIKDLL